jgi:5-oxoprolinase (ATP-hydrolysing) subunit A
MKVDLNCDMGESFGIYRLGHDEEVMPFVTSVNVACGFHASDPVNMLHTVRLAKKHHIAIGAHPSFPDLVGFGRRNMAASPEEIKADTLYQIGALWAMCRSAGTNLQHVKPHGALYAMAATDIRIATAIAEAILSVDSGLFMVCPGKSEMVEAAKRTGAKYVEEAFADRAYANDGSLVPRGRPGAVIDDIRLVAERVLSMVKYQRVASIEGVEVPVVAQTICVHGDTPGAAEMIKLMRRRLEQDGVVVRPFGQEC